jgi:hypothetical protein
VLGAFCLRISNGPHVLRHIAKAGVSQRPAASGFNQQIKHVGIDEMPDEMRAGRNEKTEIGQRIHRLGKERRPSALAKSPLYRFDG